MQTKKSYISNREKSTELTFLDDFLAVIASTFDAYSVVYFKPNSDTNHAQLLSSFSMSESMDKDSIILQGKGLVGWVIKNKEPLLYNVAEENQPNLGYYLDDTEDYIRSFLGAPVPGGGALCLDSKKNNFFHENQQHLLHLFAKLIPQIQSIINHAQRSNHIEKYFSILEQLVDLKKHYTGWTSYLNKFLHTLSVGVGFEFIAFASLSEKENHFIIEGQYPTLLNEKEFSFSGGIVGWVFRNEELVQSDGQGNVLNMPIFGKINDFPDFTASVCMPIRVEKNTVAVLTLASVTPKNLDKEFKLFMRLICEDLAQFLEVVSLRYQVYRDRLKSST